MTSTKKPKEAVVKEPKTKKSKTITSQPGTIPTIPETIPNTTETSVIRISRSLWMHLMTLKKTEAPGKYETFDSLLRRLSNYKGA